MTNLKQKSIDAIVWSLFERYGIQIVSIIIGIILARLLTPNDYGLIGMITVFFVFARVFVISGFGIAYIQKKDATDIDASTIFFFNIFVGIFFYVLLWFCAPLIAQFYDKPVLLNLTRVSSLVLIINAFGMMQINKLTKEVNFRMKSIISIFSVIASGIIGITAALNGYGVWSLVVQQISGASLTVVGLWIFYKWRPKFIFSMTSLKSMFSFSSWLLFSNIIVSFFDNLYLLMIGKFFPAAELGFYTKAQGYQRIVSRQPAKAVGFVSFSVFAKLQDNKAALKNSMKKFSQNMLFFIAPLSMVLIVIAEPLIEIVLTQKWLPMVPYLKLLLIAGLFFSLQLINVQLLISQGKSNLNFNLNLVKNALRIINLIITFSYGVYYIIIGEVIVSFLSFFVNSFYSQKIVSYGPFEQLKDVYKVFLISVLSFIFGYYVSLTFSDQYLKIIFGTLCTVITYAIFQYLFNKEFFLSIVMMIKSKLSRK